MLRIVVASKNPVKLNAVKRGFERMFPDETLQVSGVSVASGVSDQPTSDDEIFRGALNRANNAAEAQPEADYWVGLEGGVEDKPEGMEAFAWMVVRCKDDRTGRGRTGTFFLPSRVAELVREGKELGEADDIVFGRTNSKQANGAVGLLTGDVITRADFYSEAVVLALIPFKNHELY